MITMPLLICTLDMPRLGWGLLILYILQGIARGSYLAINSAVYVDTFPEPQTESAFANMCMMSALSSTAVFFAEPRLPHTVVVVASAVSGVLVLPGYFLAHRLRHRTEAEREIPLRNS